MYNTLKNPIHAQCAQVALNKLFPDMTGYRVRMIKVQQQDGNNDCGLFICAFMETLTLGLDPSQFKFD